MRGEVEAPTASGPIISKDGRVLTTTAKHGIKGPGHAASQVACRHGRQGSSCVPVIVVRRRLVVFLRRPLLAIFQTLRLQGRQKDVPGRGLEMSWGHVPSREVSPKRRASLRRCPT